MDQHADKIKAIFLNMETDNFKANLPFITPFLTSFLHFIYAQIRKHEKYESKLAISIYLMVLYLKISLKVKKWVHVMESEMPIQNMFMGWLGKNNGIKKVIRYFEDAPYESVRKEYEYMKK